MPVSQLPQWNQIKGKPSTLGGYGITDVTWANVQGKPSTINGYGLTDAAYAWQVYDAARPGTIVFLATNWAPGGWLKANGAAINRATYAALFAVIGTYYGAGDGSTTFNVPDLRGEFLRGWDDGRGSDGGRGFGSLQLDQMQGHLHAGSYNGFNDRMGGAGGTPNLRSDGATRNTFGPVSDGANGEPRIGIETRPRNVALLACIKY